MIQAEPHYYQDMAIESFILGFNESSHFNQSFPISVTT